MPPVVVVPGGVECWCGRRGCLERYLNEAALRELAGLDASIGVGDLTLARTTYDRNLTCRGAVVVQKTLGIS